MLIIYFSFGMVSFYNFSAQKYPRNPIENPNNPISAIALFEKLHKMSLYFLCKKYKVRFCACVYLRAESIIFPLSLCPCLRR